MFDVHQFLFRLDWPFFQASGAAYMKLGQNGIVSFPIKLAAFQASGAARVKLHLTNAEVGMWNAEGWSRFAKSFGNRQNTFIRRSMLEVRCSLGPLSDNGFLEKGL